MGWSGFKGEFLDQQIRLAYKIYPPIGRLLEISSKVVEMKPELMEEAAKLLTDPKVPAAFLKFSENITAHHDVTPLCKGIVKRALWLQHDSTIAQRESTLLLGCAPFTNLLKGSLFVAKNLSESGLSQSCPIFKKRLRLLPLICSCVRISRTLLLL